MCIRINTWMMRGKTPGSQTREVPKSERTTLFCLQLAGQLGCSFSMILCSRVAPCSITLIQIDGDVVFFDGTVFANLDEGVLCRYFQVNLTRKFLLLFSRVI